MQCGVHEVVCRSKPIIVSIANDGEVLQVGIPIGVDVIENHQFKETLHFDHPHPDIAVYGLGNLRIGTVVFEDRSAIGFTLANQGGHILHGILCSVGADVETACDIDGVSVWSGTETVGCCGNTIHLRGNLHRKMFVCGNLPVFVEACVPWCRFQHVGGAWPNESCHHPQRQETSLALPIPR